MLEKLPGTLKKKESLIAIFLVGLLLLVITIPTEEKESDSTKQNGEVIQKAEAEEDYCSNLERRLEEILACINGVGKVEVMITLKDTGESVVEKDLISQQATGQEQSSSTTEEETVYSESDTGTNPYVINTYRPKIQGVLVVAQGVDDPLVKQEIMEGVMALFEVESHKINIINME